MNYSPPVVLNTWRSDLKGAHDFEGAPQSQKHFHHKSKINCLFQSHFLKSVRQSFPEEANVWYLPSIKPGIERDLQKLKQCHSSH